MNFGEDVHPGIVSSNLHQKGTIRDPPWELGGKRIASIFFESGKGALKNMNKNLHDPLFTPR